LVGSLLETNLVKAAGAASKQRKVAEDFTATFPDETVETWKEMVDKWQKEPSSPNPYVSNERGMFFFEVIRSHVLQLFYQRRSFLRFDCIWLRKRLPRRSAVSTHHTKLPLLFSSGRASSLRINSKFTNLRNTLSSSNT
jgi:hypothetical protein